MIPSKESVFAYLVARGVSPIHAIGMVENFGPESGLDPNAVNPQSGAFGLGQWLGPRKKALLQFAQNPTDWQEQLDFALQEPDTSRYLAQSFHSPQEATFWFTKNWERPENAEAEGRRRAGMASSHEMPTMPNVPDTMATYQGILGMLQGPEQPQVYNPLNNPITQMGLGILGSPGYGGNAMRGIAQGVAMGGQNYAAMQAMAQKQQQDEMQRRLGILGLMIRAQAEQNKPPEIQNFYGEGPDGEMISQRQWVPGEGWQEVGRGSRWSPNQLQIPYVAGYDEEGRPLMSVGGQPLSKSTQSQQERKIIDTSESLNTLESIRRGYRKEYQEITTQAGQAWAQIKDRFGALDPEEQKSLTEYWSWKGSAIQRMNEEIHRLTGAAMTAGEAERLLAGLPDPGTGATNPGDSPTTFKAKLDAVIRDTRRVLLRHKLATRYGHDWQDMGISNLQDSALVDRYYDNVTSDLMNENPGLSEPEARKQARAKIKQELE